MAGRWPLWPLASWLAALAAGRSGRGPLAPLWPRWPLNQDHPRAALAPISRQSLAPISRPDQRAPRKEPLAGAKQKGEQASSLMHVFKNATEISAKLRSSRKSLLIMHRHHFSFCTSLSSPTAALNVDQHVPQPNRPPAQSFGLRAANLAG